MRTRLPALCLALFLGLAPAVPSAATDEAQDRPRIGLVLSGGGARGAAHIGVIQVLEELRIPIDVVAGTSMGSIIGGLYALGRSPAEMEEAIQRIDWVDVFRDDGGRDQYSFRRKQDDFNFLTRLRLGFRDGSFFLPAGLIQGQKLDFWLRVLTRTSHGSGRFGDLQLPFKAIATDAETGEAVVLERGNVATALRASMSIPGAFTPVDLDGRRLVDGGTANNLPVDVARAMGADIIIAIDISTPLRSAEELRSAVEITAQMVGIPIQQNQALQIAQLAEHDLLLVPELGDIGTASFTRLPEAVAIGATAARAHSDALRELSVSETAYQSWRERQRQPEPDLPVIAGITVENDTVLDDGVIRSRLETSVGEPLDLGRLWDDLGRVHGTDAFDLVTFDLEGDRGDELVIRAKARARGTHHLRLGVNLASDFTADSVFSIAVNHVAYPLDGYGREWRSRFQFGHEVGIGSEIYQPIGVRERFYVMPSVDYERSEFLVYDSERPAKRDELGRFDTDLAVFGFEAGINLGNVARIQGGIGYLFARAELDVGNPADQGVGMPLPPDASDDGGAALFELNYDTLDNTHFPNDGSIGTISGLFLEEALGWKDKNRRLELSLASFRTWRRNTIGIAIDYSTLLANPGNGVQSLASPRLGGFGNLSGFPRDSIFGESALRASVSAYRRVATPTVFAWDFPVYVGSVAELGSAWDGDRSDIPKGVDPLLWSTTFFTGLETPLGPLYLAYSYGEDGSHQGYLFLGQAF